MFLPCETCKFKTESVRGFRVFIGCSDQEKRDKNFKYNDFTYNHSCSAYEEELKEEKV